MSLDWRGAFCPGLKCVENMGCHGILVSTLDSQMCRVVLWWVFFFFLVWFSGVFLCVCVWFFLLLLQLEVVTLSQRVSLYANRVWIITDAPILGLGFF